MPGWRITKYNPKYRAENGAYLKDDWTSISDIGQEFDGRVFTYEAYREIEDAYVSTVMEFVSEAMIDSLKVTNLEGPHFLRKRASKLKDIVYDPKLIREGMKVSGKDLEEICRLCLREFVWCRLVGEKGFYIHFGYDYYMHIDSSVASEQSILFAQEAGLFVEEMVSPYLPRENET
ncbi:MAG: hypothetical protein WBV94_33455 [Blastocatellia bacterium]